MTHRAAYMAVIGFFALAATCIPTCSSCQEGYTRGIDADPEPRMYRIEPDPDNPRRYFPPSEPGCSYRHSKL